MSPSTRSKKLKSKHKKKQVTTTQPDTSSKRTQSRISSQESSTGILSSDPRKLNSSERDSAIELLNRDIDNAKQLPRAEANILLRAAQFLRQVLRELGSQNSTSENRNGQERQESDTSAALLKRAVDDFNQAKEQVKDAMSDTVPVESASRAVAPQATKKKPEDMTADDIREAIVEVETAIEDGKALLPADASLLLRALYVLRMALFELGGVEPALAVKDKEALERLIDANTNASGPDSATQHNLTKALDDVKRAQTQIQKKRNDREAAIAGSSRLRPGDRAGMRTGSPLLTNTIEKT